MSIKITQLFGFSKNQRRLRCRIKNGVLSMHIYSLVNKWRLSKTYLFAIAISSLSGCATYPDWLSASGASRQQIEKVGDAGRIEGVRVVDVNDTVTKRLAKNKKAGRFSDLFPSMASNNYLIGPGDIIEVTIWEASPAMLFSVFTPTSTMTAGTSNGVTLPPQWWIRMG